VRGGRRKPTVPSKHIQHSCVVVQTDLPTKGPGKEDTLEDPLVRRLPPSVVNVDFTRKRASCPAWSRVVRDRHNSPVVQGRGGAGPRSVGARPCSPAPHRARRGTCLASLSELVGWRRHICLIEVHRIRPRLARIGALQTAGPLRAMMNHPIGLVIVFDVRDD
jgi:hypothetical protein